VAKALAGPDVDHYHQAVAIVVAETFEQARAAAALVHVRYERAAGKFDLDAARSSPPVQQPLQQQKSMESAVGDFGAAFAAAPVTLDATYTTPDHGARDDGAACDHRGLERRPPDLVDCDPDRQLGAARPRQDARHAERKIRIVAPYIGGGFGGKGSILADAVLAAVAARQVGRP
jgi:xanthine dehydrogenase YagR molybdenum-binding subunit